MVCAGLVRILNEVQNIQVLGTANDGPQAVDLCRAERPNVLVAGSYLPPRGCTETFRRLRNRPSSSKVEIVVCGDPLQTPLAKHALRAGAKGYVASLSEPEELVNAVLAVAAGKRYICNQSARQLVLNDWGWTKDEDSPFDRLTVREMEIVQLVIQCLNGVEIAEALCVSIKTVHTHRYSIFDKLGVSSDVGLALLAVRYGLIDPLFTPPLPTEEKPYHKLPPKKSPDGAGRDL